MTDARGVRDPELLELFADDPEGLAIVDAIAASGPRHRAGRVRPRRMLVLAAALVVGAIAAGVFLSEQSHAGVIDKALAAVSTPHVLRLVLVDLESREDVVDLSDGNPVPVRHIIRLWFDQKTRRGRLRDSVDGITVSDQPTASAPPISASFAAALTHFTSVYRRALEDATRRDVSLRRIDGQKRYWLRFDKGALYAVAVDRHTFRPIRIVFRDRGHGHAFRVTGVALDDPRQALTPRATPRLRPIRVVAIHPSSAPTALVRAATASNDFTVDAARSVAFADGTTGFDLIVAPATVRGRLPGQFVRIQEASRPAVYFGWTSALVALTRPGHMVIRRAGHYALGYLRVGSSFVRISTPQGRTPLLAVARHLLG
jgi:hypothetical protein